VKDLFGYGDGFIDLGLKYFNYSAESLINALLEEAALPPELASLDRNMPLSTPKPTTTTTSTISTQPQPASKPPSSTKLPEDTTREYSLTERRNIFDGDEFDVMQRKVDPSRVHQHKKEVVLNEAGGKVKQFVKNYIRAEEEGEDDRMYDDEYDDSYDEFVRMEVGAEGETLDNSAAAGPAKKAQVGAERAQVGAQNVQEEEDESEGSSSEGEEGAGVGEKGAGTGSRGGGNVAGRGRGRGSKSAGYYKYKTHHRKERADRKRGFGPIIIQFAGVYTGLTLLCTSQPNKKI